jgi:hypothetical protein
MWILCGFVQALIALRLAQQQSNDNRAELTTG